MHSEEPDNKTGLFELYLVHGTRQVAPESTPGFIAAELARERKRGG